MNPGRILFISLLVIVALTAVLHVAAADPARSWMWGVHFLGFFPPWLLYAATALLLLVTVWIAVRPAWVGATADAVLARVRVGWLLPAAAIVAGAVFWLGRICHTSLGDGNVIVGTLPLRQEMFHDREPLTAWLQVMVYRAFDGWFAAPGRAIEHVAQDALAVGSVLAGVVFVFVAWFLASEIARRAGDDGGRERQSVAILVWLALLTQGYVQFFFGYVENYTFLTLALALYVWLALRALRGASPLILPGVAFLLCLALHLSAVVLAPSLLILTAMLIVDRERRVGAIRDTLIGAGAVVALHFALARAKEGYSLFATVLDVTGLAVTRRHEGIEGYLLSAMHYRDFANEQLLIGPLGLLLFLPAIAVAVVAARRHAASVFLVVAGVTYLVACWVAGDSNLGYARNWDLLAPAGLVFTAAALGILVPVARGRRLTAALLLAVLVSAYHVAPWIATNASEARSLARLKTLPLGFGRTEVVVAAWYRLRDEDEQQREWLERAVQDYPMNNNAHYLLGLYRFEHEDYIGAAQSLSRAVRLRPDKQLFREALVDALYNAQLLEEAIPHLEALLEQSPNNIQYQMYYAQALENAGRPDDARRAYARAEELLAPYVEADPDAPALNVGYGWVLLNLERYEEARGYLERALAADPELSDALCQLGHVLRNLGLDDEATERYEACLRLDPDHAEREEIEAWLDERGR